MGLCSQCQRMQGNQILSSSLEQEYSRLSYLLTTVLFMQSEVVQLNHMRMCACYVQTSCHCVPLRLEHIRLWRY